MAELRESTTVANAGQEEESYGNYDFVYGARENSDYAVGPGYGEAGAQGAALSEESLVFPTSRAGSGMPTSGFTGFEDLQGQAQGGTTSSGDTKRGGIRMTGAAGGAAAKRQPYATISQKTTVFPKGMQWPTFSGPTWNEQAIRAKARKFTAPVTAELGAKVQQAMARYYENPNVRRMVLRDTLQGYGIGLGRAIAAGESAARQEYTSEYSRQYAEAMDAYSRALGELTAKATQVSSSMEVYSAKEYEEATGLDAPKAGTGGAGSSIGIAGKSVMSNPLTGRYYI